LAHDPSRTAALPCTRPRPWAWAGIYFPTWATSQPIHLQSSNGRAMILGKQNHRHSTPSQNPSAISFLPCSFLYATRRAPASGWQASAAADRSRRQSGCFVVRMLLQRRVEAGFFLSRRRPECVYYLHARSTTSGGAALQAESLSA
jgi:hypothetical protein